MSMLLSLIFGTTNKLFMMDASTSYDFVGKLPIGMWFPIERSTQPISPSAIAENVALWFEHGQGVTA
jgi:hypothetical protein